MIFLRPHDIIKHQRFSDVAFLVHRCHGPFGNDNRRFKIKGEWLNQGAVESWSLGIIQTIEVPVDKMSEWLVCLEPAAVCLRYAKWKEMR